MASKGCCWKVPWLGSAWTPVQAQGPVGMPQLKNGAPHATITTARPNPNTADYYLELAAPELTTREAQHDQLSSSSSSQSASVADYVTAFRQCLSTCLASSLVKHDSNLSQVTAVGPPFSSKASSCCCQHRRCLWVVGLLLARLVPPVPLGRCLREST